MCRLRVYNSVDVVRFRVVLMTIVVFVKTADSQSKGYREILGIPWAPYQSSPQGMSGHTQPMPHQAPSNQLDMENRVMRQNYGEYTRRSANELSPAEKEYQAVRRALARERVQPMRRSMVPTRRAMSQTTGNCNDKISGDLLPLIYTLSSLIDKLDSPVGQLEQKTRDGAGSTKHRVIVWLGRVIGRLERRLRRKTKRLKIASENGKETRKKYLLSDDSDSPVASENRMSNEKKEEDVEQNQTENGNETKSSAGGNWSDSLTTANVSKPETKSFSLLPKVNTEVDKSFNGDEKSSHTMKFDPSTIPAPMLLPGNKATKTSSALLGSSTGLVLENAGSRNFKVTQSTVTEHAGISVYLFKRSIDNMNYKVNNEDDSKKTVF